MLTDSSAGAALLDLPAAPVPASGDASPFLRRARSIADGLRARAVRTGSGAATWMLEPVAPGGARAPMDPYLFGGSGGVALFLAALDHATGSDAHRELVLGALAPVRRSFARMAADPDGAPPALLVGGLVGVGAVVYGLVRTAGWTGDDALLDDAHAFTRLLTPARIHADEKLDVLHGSAGAILALLALHAARPAPNADGRTPLDVAEACAEHLLAWRAEFDGARAWPSGGGAPRPGFGHGPAGIGHALLRLHAHTGDARLRQAALDGFAYERALYHPARRDWWNARFGRFLEVQSWCTGAPGIAVSRLEAIRSAGGADGAVLRGEMDDALAVAADLPDSATDDLCCGNLGRADLLLHAGLALNDAPLLDAARAIAQRALDRAPTDADFGFAPESPARTLSLFRGVAGIGWALLRQARPGALPCCPCLE